MTSIFSRGRFRVRGGTIDVFPPYEEDRAFRIIHDEGRIESIYSIDPLTGRVLERFRGLMIFPTTHYVMPRETIERAIATIDEELVTHLDFLRFSQ